MTGPTGPTGPAFAATFFNPVSRYQMVAATGGEVWAVSSASVEGDLPWTRSGTTLTITNPGHGRSLNDMVLARNVNIDPCYGQITRVDTDTFDLPTGATGATGGAQAAYSLGFSFAHIGDVDAITGGTLAAPAGGDVQLLSLRVHLAAGVRSGSTYDLVLPASSVNGSGGDTSNADIFLPTQTVRNDTDGLGALGATLSKNVGASYNTLEVGALPATTTGLFILWQF
jgi:hypothetical protein